MANVRKRISELTPLTSASLDTTIVGVDNGITYKIELDTLADAVTSRVNILDRDRLSSLESVTSSFETKGRSVISSSAQITTFGFISTSVDISSLNSFTQSQNVTNTAFTNGINARLQTSSFNDFSASVHTEILAATNEQDLSYLVTTSSFNTYTASISTGSLVNRLSSLENNTGSYLTSLNGTISSSAQITAFGFISQSADISSLNSFTASQQTLNTAFNNGISTRLQTSSFNDFSASVDSRIIAATNEQSFNGLISGSSQLTSSYDERYVLSGSITQTTWDNIASKPSDIVSGSSQLTSSLDTRYAPSASYLTSLNGAFSSSIQTLGGSGVYSSSAQLPSGLISGSSQLTASYDTRYTLSGSVSAVPAGTISGSAQITTFGFISSSQTIDTGSFLTTSSYQTDSASFDTRINSIITESGSNLTYFIEAYANVTYTLPGTFTEDICRYSVVSATENVPSNWFNTSSYTFTPQKAGYWEIIASYDVYRNAEASLIIKKNNNIVASAGSFNAVAQDISKIVYLNGSTDYINIYNVGGAALQRDQYQSRSWFQAKFVGNISGSTELPSGLVSGSSQLTSSFDTRYTLSGSVVSGTTPAGTISGSSQLTSSFDSRYVQTGSFNSLTASFNSFTASAQSVTTGSNSFNGTQTITGSLIITTGSFVGSQILANTSSLYLTSGSNMYVQNNGVVEITGSLKVNGTTRLETVGGDEGGEIEFGVPQTNTTLSTRVVTDIFQNRLRIFDGNTNGVFIDLSKAPTGVSGELMHKASGFVNRGVDVTLGNLKARIAATGNASLQLSTVSGTYSVYGSGVYSQAGGVAGSNLSSTISITTTPTYLVANYNFGVAGAVDTWNIVDVNLGIAWRITMIVGFTYNNNFISIERLH